MSKVIISKENNKKAMPDTSRKMCQGEKVCASYVLTGDAQMPAYLFSGNTGEVLGLSLKTAQ
jgi:hypothetical protein